jgi:hypothetical protein
VCFSFVLVVGLKDVLSMIRKGDFISSLCVLTVKQEITKDYRFLCYFYETEESNLYAIEVCGNRFYFGYG